MDLPPVALYISCRIIKSSQLYLLPFPLDLRNPQQMGAPYQVQGHERRISERSTVSGRPFMM